MDAFVTLVFTNLHGNNVSQTFKWGFREYPVGERREEEYMKQGLDCALADILGYIYGLVYLLFEKLTCTPYTPASLQPDLDFPTSAGRSSYPLLIYLRTSHSP